MSVFSSDERRKRALDALKAVGDVTRVVRPAEQVVLYPGHYPPGAFLVLAGRLVVEPEPSQGAGRGTFRIDAKRGPVLVPPLAELEEKVTARLSTETKVELLFLPKSLLGEGTPLERLLQDVGPAECSLRW